MSFIRGAISTLNDRPLKLVDKFTYLGSHISSTLSEDEANYRLVIYHMEVRSIG